jgi:hypothetical protein
VLTGVLWEEHVLRVTRSRKKWGAAVVGVAVIGTAAAVALGSPSFNFTPTTLVTANLDNKVELNNDRIKLQTKDPANVRVQQVVFTAGGYSGWHHHPGFVIVAVASGAVTLWQADCSSATYGPGLPNGSSFVETGGSPVQVTSNGATAYVTYVVPQVTPGVYRIEDTPPSCP